jgi:elongation factor P
MIPASSVRNGMVLRIDNRLYKVLTAEYHTGSAKMGGLVHTKLKDLKTGLFLDRKFKPEEKVDSVELDRKTMEYLYKDADGYYMMDPESFEQTQLDPQLMEAFDPFLQPNMRLAVEFLNEEPINVIFPEWVDLEVVSTAPPLSTLQDEVPKPAKLSNGMEIQVPQFIKPKDIVRVNVQTRKYMERIKK